MSENARDMNLSLEDIRGLAQLERDMDSGKVPFVVNGDTRWPFHASVLEACGVVSGQTVSNTILRVLMRVNIQRVQARKAEAQEMEAGCQSTSA